MKYRLNEPSINAEDEDAVLAVLQDGWLGLDGARTKTFEDAIAARHGHIGGVAVQSGTAATHTALHAVFEDRKAHGIFRGGKVAVSDFTCAAPAAAIVHAGGTPVFVDVNRLSLNMDHWQVRDLLGQEELDAVILVHLYGQPAEAAAIRLMCNEYGVTMIEDCCEAHGAEVENTPRAFAKGEARFVPVGSMADVSVFSIRSEKIIGVGEGGVAITSDGELMRRMQQFASRGKDRDHLGWVWRFWTAENGYNYKLPHLLGALALSQLDRMDEFIAARRKIAARYRDLITGYEWQEMDSRGSAWLNFIRFPVDEEGIEDLNAKGVSPYVKAIGDRLMELGVEVRPGFIPLRRHAAFAAYVDDAGGISEGDRAVWSGLCLPSHPGIDENAQNEICAMVVDTAADVL